MQEYYYLQFVTNEILCTIEELTRPTNIFVKEIHIKSGKTVVNYEILTMEGFKQKEQVFFNDIKK